MRRLIITAAISLSVSLSGLAGVARAQQSSDTSLTTDADGSSVTSTAGVNPTASGEGTTIVYGDINTGAAGHTVITPPTVIQTSAPPPVEPAPAPEPAPVADTATDTSTDAATAPADTADSENAVASETDLDADNEPDALEPDLGLDPNNADTDGDGVADGDELNIYSTDPTVFDTDGDSVSDGEELFGSKTDPLTWNDFSAENGEATDSAALQQPAATTPRAVPQSTSVVAPGQVIERTQNTTENLTATDGNASALGTGNASASPGSVTRSGTALLGPDGAYNVSDTAPPVITVGVTGDLPPAPEPAPVETSTDTAPVDTSSEAPVDTTATDTAAAPADSSGSESAVASETDLDADNEPDALEPDLGLDPNNADTDGDGVADGDELTNYGTDPTVFDTDGDGVSDGEELFGTQTDPLVWDTDGDGVADGQQPDTAPQS
jgi:hypothetical protein